MKGNCVTLLRKGLGWLVLAVCIAFLWYSLIHGQPFFSRVFKIEWGLFSYVLGAFLTLGSINILKQNLGLVSSKRIRLEHNWQFLIHALRQMTPSIESTKELLSGFVKLVKNEMKVKWVQVYLFREDKARCVISTGNWSDEVVELHSELCLVLQQTKTVFSVEKKMSDDLAVGGLKALEQLEELKADRAIGMHFQGRLVGIVFLGERLVKSLRKNRAEEQFKLEVLVNQLTLALESIQLSAQLRQNNIYHMKLLEALLEQLGSGVLVVDPKGFILICNQEARHLLQWPEGSSVPSSLEGLPQEIHEVLHQVLVQGEAIEEGKMLVRLKEDHELFILYGCHRFTDNQGKILGAQFIFQDISQVKRLEKQLHHANRLANLGTLSASMVHEIKNPLVAIKTFVQLLPERINDEEFLQKFSRLIGHEVGRIDQIVSQMLTLARPSSISFTKFRLHEVVEAMLALYQPDLVHRKIKVHKELKADADMIQGDRQKIQQILMNLVVNAEEAMRKGGTLIIHTAIVMRSMAMEEMAGEEKMAAPEHPYICLTVQDSGHGMMPKVLKRVFEPFYSTKTDGNGLGLSIVIGIIKDHGGMIEVKSELNQGTKFHLYFPLVSKESYI